MLASESAASYRRAVVGERRTVLWEGERGRSGLTEDYLRVALTDPAMNRLLAPHDYYSANDTFERVVIVGVRAGVLLAEPV